MKMGYFIFAVAVLFFSANIAWSSEYRDHVYIGKTTSNPPGPLAISNIKGVASAISAAQCHFDAGSYDLQLCGATGFSDGKEALTLGVGKKYKDFLISGTISVEDNRTRYGAGINWKIK